MAGNIYSLAVVTKADVISLRPFEMIDVTALMAAVCEMRQAWRENRETYSVEVMQAFGAVIREAEALIDFTPESEDWGDPQ